MFKKYIARALSIILIAFVLFPSTVHAFELIKTGSQGEIVNRIQIRLIDLGYLNFKPTGSFGGMTRVSTISFQDINGIMADGSIGEESLNALFSNTAKRAPILPEVKIPIGPTAKDPFTKTGKLADWVSIVDPLLKSGDTFIITDLNTDKTFKMVRSGGKNHAEMEPATATDATAFLTAFGGTPNWSKRPVLVLINAEQYAASLSGMPHGKDTIVGDDVKGTCCLYFENSKSEVKDLVDEEHRVTVLKAAGIQ